MASVYVKRGKFYARWMDAHGRWRHTVLSCRTKRDALNDAIDLERKADRQRRGLEPLLEDAPERSFGELFEWWWSEYGSRQRGDMGSFLRRHLLLGLGKLSAASVTTARIEELLQARADALSPKSLNTLRGALHTIFAKATKRALWAGANPAAAVERRKVPRKLFATLRAEEVPPLLNALALEWRSLFATAIWTGMRKGELLGLLKTDVDLAARTIAVRRSYDNETTKGGHDDVIPIAEPLVPYLEMALAGSPSKLAFPAADGSMRSDETDLQQVLRRALGRAGIVLGYDFVCRRKGCGNREHHSALSERRCPKCGMRLWPKALPRPLRFHDLRGTTGTLLARAGAPLVVAQRILRHTDPRLTANIYSRVDLGDLRDGINRIALPADGLAGARTPSHSATLQGLVAPVSPEAQSPKGEGRDQLENAQGNRGPQLVGETGFEPATPWSRRRKRRITRRFRGWQWLATSGNDSRATTADSGPGGRKRIG
jgi:integrase